jgi:hypothetical protein
MALRPFIIPISKGLLDPKHAVLVSNITGLFLFLIDRTTKEKNGEGWVLGGAPISYAEIAAVLGASARSLERWKARLEQMGYIRTERTNKNGELKWCVMKSKKFSRVPAEMRGEVPARVAKPEGQVPAKMVGGARNLANPIREDREIDQNQPGREPLTHSYD